MNHARGASRERLIFHVDVNSAFLSWEAARRVREGGADLRLVPSAVGGAPEDRTCVVLAKSIPAKRFGVRTGEPVAMALRKCPGLVLAPPDFRLYDRCSCALMDVCHQFSPAVERFSIDECFLDMTGTGLLYPDPLDAAYALKDRIRDELGFTVNVGVSSNKFLAKAASDFEKPDRVHALWPGDLEDRLWPLPAGELFSVGQATAARLTGAGIRTIGDLARADPKRLQAVVGAGMGRRLHRYANGEDDSPVLADPAEAKGYSISTTFREDLTEMSAARLVLLDLADSVTARMRADAKRAGGVSVTLRSSDFRDRSHQTRLSEPTDVTDEVCETARRLLAEAWNGRTPLRLLGIALTHLTSEDALQLSLFSDERRERARRMDKAVDALRRDLGFDIIRRGGGADVGRKYRAQLENRRERRP